MSEKLKKYLAPATLAGTALSAFPALAAGEGTVVTSADWASVISALTAQISVSTVVGVLATIVSAGVGLVFMWWGVRKALRSLMSAFRRGRMSA